MATEQIALLALAGAAICWLILVAPNLRGLWRKAKSQTHRRLGIEQLRVDLVQSQLSWINPAGWLSLRWAVTALIALAGYLIFGILVLGLASGLAAYHLLGLTLEARRRKARAERQQALLDAIRLGVSVMSRAGGALQMLRSLAQSGPSGAQPLFRQLVAEAESPEADLAQATERIRIQVADPLFDDLALALTLHWKRGGKLVPALTALCEDWGETLRLEREAKALRAGIEASALLLTLLPFVLILLIHLLSPSLLVPLSTPLGQIVLAAIVAWMAIGYRILQQMAQAPGEERMAFNQSAL